MLENIDTHLVAQQEPMKQALVELVRIPSVCDEGGGGFPFGAAVDQALRKTLQLAADLGFKTKYDERGYYGYAEVGEGAEMLGILGHVDVVPPGKLSDWDVEPFNPLEKDGMIYGRGTQDDKGPVIASLYAVKALIDAGVKFNKRVRFIFGTDEETLWRCIYRYRDIEEAPTLGFSPDGYFPLIFAEKGVLQLTLEGSNESGVRLTGGSAFNAVPDTFFYEGERQDDLADKLDQLGFEYEWNEDGIEVKGRAAHAMIPEQGVNAIARLCIALHAIGIHSKAIDFIAQEIREDPNATRIFGDNQDEVSGKLKFNVGMINTGKLEQLSIDSRIPVTRSKEEVVAKLSATAARYGLTYKEFDWLAPIYVPLDHFMIQALMKVYRQVSGDQASPPIALGGATYARAFKNCVCFGALFPGKLLTEHEPNERAVLEELYAAMEVYAHAVYELTR
jgi:succinyl-diaminopimelate desuccinylase